MATDFRPIVLVILDGLGDKPLPELDGRTPSEAAHTPHLDALTTRGVSGWHLPFGPGRATSSERSHWAMFGYADVAFPGRAVIEALGCEIDVSYDTAVMHGALRMADIREGTPWIVGRAGFADAADVTRLLPVVTEVAHRFDVTVDVLDIPGEVVLTFNGAATADVTDSDPFFDATHPYMQVAALHDTTRPNDAAALATRTNLMLTAVHDALTTHPVNAERVQHGRQPINVLTTKWAGVRRRDLPGFTAQTGLRGSAVTGTRLYRGLVQLLDMAQIDTKPGNLTAHMAFSVDGAKRLIANGAEFVHLHTKATDEAGHTKQPHAKRDVLEQIDAGLEGLFGLTGTAVVCVTGDHATPSRTSVLHTADATPLLIAGPDVSPDTVTRFGERFMKEGHVGRITAKDMLWVLAEAANRPAFFGHRPAARDLPALPRDVQAFAFDR